MNCGIQDHNGGLITKCITSHSLVSILRHAGLVAAVGTVLGVFERFEVPGATVEVVISSVATDEVDSMSPAKNAVLNAA